MKLSKDCRVKNRHVTQDDRSLTDLCCFFMSSQTLKWSNCCTIPFWQSWPDWPSLAKSYWMCCQRFGHRLVVLIPPPNSRLVPMCESGVFEALEYFQPSEAFLLLADSSKNTKAEILLILIFSWNRANWRWSLNRWFGLFIQANYSGWSQQMTVSWTSDRTDPIQELRISSWERYN